MNDTSSCEGDEISHSLLQSPIHILLLQGIYSGGQLEAIPCVANLNAESFRVVKWACQTFKTSPFHIF